MCWLRETTKEDKVVCHVSVILIMDWRGRETSRQAGKQAERQASRQADRQTGRLAYTRTQLVL